MNRIESNQSKIDMRYYNIYASFLEKTSTIAFVNKATRSRSTVYIVNRRLKMAHTVFTADTVLNNIVLLYSSQCCSFATHTPRRR